MLYKKYHRNFVSQFKIGTRFKISRYGKEIECVVDIEPFIYDISSIFPISINVGAKVIIDDGITTGLPVFEPLVTSGGRLGLV